MAKEHRLARRGLLKHLGIVMFAELIAPRRQPKMPGLFLIALTVLFMVGLAPVAADPPAGYYYDPAQGQQG